MGGGALSRRGGMGGLGRGSGEGSRAGDPCSPRSCLIPCRLIDETLDFLPVPPDDYEIYRQRLEEQLRADVELLYEAYRAKLRAYETVLRTRAEIGAGPWPPPDLTLRLPPAPGLQETSPPPPPAARAHKAPKRPRSKAFSVIEAVEGALGRLEEVFDRNDLIRALGFEPNRATLHRVLEQLKTEGVLAIETFGSGKQPTLYRKLTSPAPS